ERASSPTSPPFANRRSATEVHGVFTDSAISLRCVAGVRLRPSRGASFLPHRNIRTRGAAKGWEPGYRLEDQAPSRGDYHSGAFRPGEWGWTGGAEGGATYPPRRCGEGPLEESSRSSQAPTRCRRGCRHATDDEPLRWMIAKWLSARPAAGTCSVIDPRTRSPPR